MPGDERFTLRLCAESAEPLGMEAVDHADLSSRICIAQRGDHAMLDASRAEGAMWRHSRAGRWWLWRSWIDAVFGSSLGLILTFEILVGRLWNLCSVSIVHVLV